MQATLCLNSWAGRVERPVEIVKETTKKYKVRLLEDTLLPSGLRRAGSEVYVPKYAVRLDTVRRRPAKPGRCGVRGGERCAEFIKRNQVGS